MPRYLVQASYNTQGITDLVKNPQDRSAAVRAVVERLGGSIESFDYALGDYDVVANFQVPDNVSAVALAMAVGAGESMRWYPKTRQVAKRESSS